MLESDPISNHTAHQGHTFAEQRKQQKEEGNLLPHARIPRANATPLQCCLAIEKGGPATISCSGVGGACLQLQSLTDVQVGH